MAKRPTRTKSVSAKRAVSPSTQAMVTGRKLAANAIRDRDAALKHRQAALRQQVTAAAPRAALPRLVAAAGAPARATLVAEGDSWFNYPFHDVLSMLEDHHGYDVESVAHAGDTVEAMAYSGGQLGSFTSTIEKLLRRGVVPAAILLSGGGNDVAGDEFAVLLDHALSPSPGLNDMVVRGVIEGRVKNAYVTILSAVTAICEQRTGHTIPIVMHGYDHPVPDGRGILGGFGPLPGPWLQPGFRQKGFDDPASTLAIVGDLIDRFNAMLQTIPQIAGLGHVRYLDLRGTLKDDNTYKTWWANELHPTERGFAAIADKFANVL